MRSSRPLPCGAAGRPPGPPPRARLPPHQVELCLLHQISSRQESFFTALSNLQALRQDVGVACTSVATLRAGIGDLQRHMVGGVMRVPQLARRKENLAALAALLERITELADG